MSRIKSRINTLWSLSRPTAARPTLRPVHLLALALAAGSVAHAQTAPAPSAPPAPAAAAASSAWSLTSFAQGRTVKVESAGGKTTVELDGVVLDPSRYTIAAGRLIVKDEQGKELFAATLPDAPTAPSNMSVNISRGTSNSPSQIYIGPRRFGAAGGNLGGPALAEQPRMMVGIQLIEADPILRGHLGLGAEEGVLVSAVYDGLPAAAAGVAAYDIVLKIDGKSPKNVEELRGFLREKESGKPITLELLHRGARVTRVVTPEPFDQNRLSAAKVSAIAAADSSDQWNATIGRLGSSININDFLARAREGGSSVGAVIGGGPNASAGVQMLTIPGPSISGDPASEDPQMKAMQERMRELEDMMRKMVEQRLKQLQMSPGFNPAAPGAAPAPAASPAPAQGEAPAKPQSNRQRQRLHQAIHAPGTYTGTGNNV